MRYVEDYRAQHLKNLCRERKQHVIAKAVGRAAPQIAQLTSVNKGHRVMTENMAREFEVCLGLPNGYFDQPIDIPPGESITEQLVAAGFPPARVRPTRSLTPPTLASVTSAPVIDVESRVVQPVSMLTAPAAPAPSAPLAMTPEQLREIILLVGQVCDAENVSLPPVKFSDIAALTLADAIDHGNQPRPDHVKTLVRLAK